MPALLRRSVLVLLAFSLITVGRLIMPTILDARQLNVLFIAVDDLRPELGCYGNPAVQTPCMDALSKQGVRFNRAYCQVSQCNQSRTCVLTGMRPDTTKVYDLQTHFRKHLPDIVTLPQCFKQHGYHVRALGKIFHKGLDDPPSWSEPVWFPPGSAGGSAVAYGPAGRATFNLARTQGRARSSKKGPAWEVAEVADNDLPDGATADRAIEVLKELKDQPFFLAVGFVKPHLPFVAPKTYWDQYSPGDIVLAKNLSPPWQAPEYAFASHDELVGYLDVPQHLSQLTAEQSRRLIHGYWAATSYVDAQVGRVLKCLDELGLRESTVIVLWGDHGFHLGDQGMWGKTSNYEVATRVPLLVSVPGNANSGSITDGIVELVDLYPSLLDVCELPIPQTLEGVSFKPLLDVPGREWKKGALSQFLRPSAEHGPVMGRAVRTNDFRLIEWRTRNNEILDYELYDYRDGRDETVNLAKRPEYATDLKRLARTLAEGWRALRP